MRRLPALVAALVLLAGAGGVAIAVVADDDNATHTTMMGPARMSHGDTRLDEPGYLAEMVAHHQEAVAAALELSRSDRSEMREFGASVVAVQSAQIRQMTTWLVDWYPDHPQAVDYEPMMRDLTGLSGDDLDRAFLEDMIGHHMAAVMLSQQLLMRGPDHEDVAVLARSIRDDQHVEIVQMRRWLRQWFGS